MLAKEKMEDNVSPPGISYQMYKTNPQLFVPIHNYHVVKSFSSKNFGNYFGKSFPAHTFYCQRFFLVIQL